MKQLESKLETSLDQQLFVEKIHNVQGDKRERERETHTHAKTDISRPDGLFFIHNSTIYGI